MFTSIKNFINSRLGKGVVSDDITNDYGYFITIAPKNLYSVLSFLRNDPDLKLNLLDQIYAIPSRCFPSQETESKTTKIFYQLKSLKLPYRVTVILDLDATVVLPSIASLYSGARWQEDDLRNTYGLIIDEGRHER